MRAVSGGILIVVGLLLFYLIVTGRLAAALAAFQVLSTGQAPAAGAAAAGAGNSGVFLGGPLDPNRPLGSSVSPAPSPTAPSVNPFRMPALTQPAVPTLVH